MRVIRIIARLNTGGPARHVTLLCDRLTRHGYSSLLVHGALGPGEGSLEHLAASTVFRSETVPELSRRLRPLDDARALSKLLRIMFRERPAVVHTHTSKAGALGRLAALCYNATRAPAHRAIIVHTFHGHVFAGYFGPVGAAAARGLERLLACGSDAIIAISPRQADDLVHRFRIAPAAKVHVVPLGLDLTAFASGMDRAAARAMLGYAADEVVLGFIGRLVPIKNPELLLTAFASAHAADARLRLLIVGDGELRAPLEARAGALGLGGCIRFAGWRHDLARIYAALDAVVLTSDNEGTPVALIEAAAAGLPVVATDVGGVADVVVHGRHGLLTPPGDGRALASAFTALAASAAERRRMGEAARVDVASRYQPDRLAEDIHALYARCLSRRRGRASGPLVEPAARGLEG